MSLIACVYLGESNYLKTNSDYLYNYVCIHKALSLQNDQFKEPLPVSAAMGETRTTVEINKAWADNEATCLFCVSSFSAAPLDCGPQMKDHSFRQHCGQNTGAALPLQRNGKTKRETN